MKSRDYGSANSKETEQSGEIEDVGVQALAGALGALHRGKGGRPLLRDGGSQSLGGLLFAWADVGVQVARRMVTLSAELGDEVFGRSFGAAGAVADDVAVGKPVKAEAKDTGLARGSFELENRRSGHVEVRFPRVIEFHAAKGHDRRLVELRFDPEAPIVCADAAATITVEFDHSELLPGERYIGWATLETARGGKCSLAIEVTAPRKPSPSPTPAEPATPKVTAT
jgi:hypothetical protein